MLIKFIAQEIQAIYDKYNKITTEEEELVTSFIIKTEDQGLNFDPFFNYSITKAFAENLEGEGNIDIVKLYILLLADFELSVNLEEVKGVHETLKARGYVQIDKYLLYHDYSEDGLESIIEDALAKELEIDVDLVMKCFDEEEIANMWMDSTDSIEAAKYFIQNNGWDEVLGIEDMGEVYKDKYNSKVCCCLNEGITIEDL